MEADNVYTSKCSLYRNKCAPCNSARYARAELHSARNDHLIMKCYVGFNRPQSA